MNRIALLIPHYNNPQGLADSLASVGPDECVVREAPGTALTAKIADQLP